MTTPLRFCSFICLLAACAHAGRAVAETPPPFLVVQVDQAPLQSGQEILKRLPAGELLLIEKVQAPWYSVQVTQDARPLRGWLNATNVQVFSAEPEQLSADEKQRLLDEAQKLQDEAEENEDAQKQIALNAQALLLRTRAVGFAHFETAESLSALGQAFKNAKRRAEARQCLQRAIVLYEQHKGKVCVERADALSHLGKVLTDEDEREAALAAYQEALELFLQIRGPNHIAVLNSHNSLAYALVQFRDFKAAREHFEMAIKIGKQLPPSIEICNVVTGLGWLHEQLAEYPEALARYKEGLVVGIQVEGEDGETVIFTRARIFAVLLHLGKRKEANSELQQLLASSRRAHGESSYEVGLQLVLAGKALRDATDYAAAQPMFEQGLPILRKTLGNQHPHTLATMGDLAMVNVRRAKHEQAFALFQELIAIRVRVDGPESMQTLVAKSYFGNALLAAGRIKESRQLLVETARVAERALVDDQDSLARILTALGHTYLRNGESQLALETFRKVLELRRRIYGDKHPDVAECHFSIAGCYYRLGDFQQSHAHYKTSLHLYEAAYGPRNEATIEAYSQLGMTSEALGKLSEARQLLEKGVALSLEVYGDSHEATARALKQFAYFCDSIDEYAAAAKAQEQSYRIFAKLLGEDHPSAVSARSSLAHILGNMGRVADALALYKECLASCARNPEGQNLILINQGISQFVSGAEGIVYMERALKLAKEIYPDDHPDMSTLNYDLANAYFKVGNDAAAIPLLRHSLTVCEKKYGRRSLDCVSQMTLLAHSLTNIGQVAEAERLCAEAVSICLEKDLTHSSLNSVVSYDNWGLALLKAGNFAAAVDSYDEARRAEQRQISLVLPGLTASEQLDYFAERSRRLHISLSLALRRPSDIHAVENSAVWLLNAKARVHETLAERAQLAKQSGNPEAARIAGELNQVRAQQAELSLASWNESEVPARRAALAELKIQEGRLARQLGQLGLRSPESQQYIELGALRRSIPQDAMFVDVFAFRQFDFDKLESGKLKYCAWITPAAGNGDVRFVELGDATRVDAAIQATRVAINDGLTQIPQLGEQQAEQAAKASLRKLAQLVLDPLLPTVGNARQLIVSPDSTLWLVPWGALPLADGSYAIERYDVSCVLNGRDLLRQRPQINDVAPPMVFANPDFSGNGTAASGTRARVLPDFTQLPGTAVEARAIAPSLKGFAAADPQLHFGAAASEEAFKNVRSPRVLALCTHGFFLEDQPDSASGNEGQRGDASPMDLRLQNPLLRCGLALAGANGEHDPNTSESAGNDGVLTGLEILSADLRGTELVVLSACETGLGDIQQGDGVAGLRQAFLLAGAESVVASLWQVDDRETAQLMNDFFQNLAASDSKSTALRKAQRARIEARRKRYGAAHPYFWAAFTLTGSGAE